MPTCIYCLNTKDSSEFNREHVIPEAFGKFEHNFVLHNQVCTQCNELFGKTLDASLARESLEGLDRYDLGIKPPSGSTKFRAGGRVRGVIDEGPYKGAAVRWAPSPDGQAIALLPQQPQIGFSTQSSAYEWFNLDSLPSRDGFRMHGSVVAKGTHVDILFQGVAEEEGTRLLEAKGWSFKSASKRIDVHGRVRTMINVTVDREILRAIAKIAFNYFAHEYPQLALMAQFNEIRGFVLAGTRGSAALVDMTPDATSLIQGTESNTRLVAHCVAVEWIGGHVVGHVTLGFRFRYRVTLASGGFLIAPTCVDSGHLFNLDSRIITRVRRGPRA